MSVYLFSAACYLIGCKYINTLIRLFSWMVCFSNPSIPFLSGSKCLLRLIWPIFLICSPGLQLATLGVDVRGKRGSNHQRHYLRCPLHSPRRSGSRAGGWLLEMLPILVLVWLEPKWFLSADFLGLELRVGRVHWVKWALNRPFAFPKDLFTWGTWLWRVESGSSWPALLPASVRRNC